MSNPNKWNKMASEESLRKTIESLKNNANINAILVKNGKEALAKVKELIPEDSEVMAMTSITLDSLGIGKLINESGKYNSVRNKLNSMDRKTQSSEMQKLGAAPEYAIGSVHAVTEDGKVIIASNTGSQLPAYVYGSSNVIWVVGTQKIVKNLDEGINRVYEHSLPMESERAKKVYGVSGSFVSKILIFNKEPKEGRVTLIFVPEVIGY